MSTSSLILPLFTLWFFALLCNAENHNCINGITMKMVIDDSYHADETIIPRLPNEPMHKQLDLKKCKWELQITIKNKHSQIVLQGMPSEDVSTETESIKSNNSKLMLTSPSGNARIVFSGMFHVYPLAEWKNISTELNWNPRTQNVSSTNLRILLPLAGLCSSDMLSFHGNCHAVSPVRENVTVAMSNIKGDAQLASFISMSQISGFIAANSDKLTEHPFRRIIDLSQPVRLGMFYNATDARILSVVRNESGGCLLQEVDRPEELLVTGRVTGACGSLRVDDESGRAVIEFGDCNSRMLALMSFPETASSVSAAVTECGSDLVQQVMKLEAQFLRLGVSKFDSPTPVSADGDTIPKIETKVHDTVWQPAVPTAIIVCVCLFIVFAIPFVAIICCITQRTHDTQRAESSATPARFFESQAALIPDPSHIGESSVHLHYNDTSVRV